MSENEFTAEDVIARDVCILGGGSTGTYAAINLKDKGQDIIIIERSDHLGGHTETEYFPDNKYINYGVQAFFPDKHTKDYFARLGVDWETYAQSDAHTDYVNFKTGQRIEGSPNATLDFISAIKLYRSAIEKYDYLNNGLFELPDPVPEELLRPFGEFVEKNNLWGALDVVFKFSHNVGDFYSAPLLYVINYFGVPHANALIDENIRLKKGNYDMYTKATEILGSDVMYESVAVGASRSESGARIVVKSADGSRKLVKAKHLLITMPPLLKNLEGFDLDEDEIDIFDKWVYQSSYIAVLNDTGVSDKTDVANLDPNQKFGNFPIPPFVWQLSYSGVSGYITAEVVGDMEYAEDEAKKLIMSDISRMSKAGTYPPGEPKIVKFTSHTPAAMMAPVDELRNGFYKRLYSLQGRRSTFYTGFTFCSDNASLLWPYTDKVVEKMLG